MQLKVGWGLADLGWTQLGGSASDIGAAGLGLSWPRSRLRPGPPEYLLSQAYGQLVLNGSSAHDHDRGIRVQVETQEAS